MPNTLNLSGLNGLTVDPTTIGLEAGARDASGTYTVSSSGNHNLLTIYTAGIVQTAPVTLGFKTITGVNSTGKPRNTNGYNISVKVKQAGHSGTLVSGVTFKVGGWNSDGILLVNHEKSGPFQYVVISDQSLPNGTPANLKFTTSGPVPTIDGVTPTVICFAAGTRIATLNGAAAIENLQPGDLVRTASGGVQPVGWVGQRLVRCAGHAQPASVAPVRIAAGAFGDALPENDLFLSPEHAVFVDGALVPVHVLVNGTTIQQVAVTDVTYYHIELPRHDVVLAEGLPTESYLETGSRDALSRYDRTARAA